MSFEPLKLMLRPYESSTAEAFRRGLGLSSRDRGVASYRVTLANERELGQWVRDIVGIELPAKRCCPGHKAPMEAFAASYFAEHPTVVWKASRGLGGKSVMLAALSYTEAITLGAAVVLLGGSLLQATRVHDYIAGEDTNLPHAFLGSAQAPRHLLREESSRQQTKLWNGGHLLALPASSRSVRGPHPQRLRLDEVDEMELAIYKAATGQPMDRSDPITGALIRSQITISSTWHYPDQTMTYVLAEAERQGWPVFEWCFREALKGWLTQESVDRKRAQVPSAMWETEFELQEPSPEARAIAPSAIAAAFDAARGRVPGDDNQYYEFEKPERGVQYVTATDWAKEVDWTVISTYRIDTAPARLVAWERCGRLPWPLMVGKHCDRVRRYPGAAFHDAHSHGRVVQDYLTAPSIGLDLIGKNRTDVFASYIQALEHGEITNPWIEYMRAEHRFASFDAIFGSGHPPDSFVSAAMAWYGVRQLRGALPDEDTVTEGFVL